MPINTPRLKIPKPLGNEIVKRTSFGEIWDVLEQNVATRQEPELQALDVFGATGFVMSSTDLMATKNGVTPTQLDVAAGVGYLALSGGAGLRRFAQAATSFTTALPSTTFYLDAQPDGTYSWGAAHSSQTGYLALWEVTTNGAGQILVMTDRRVIGKGPKAQGTGTSITDAGNYFNSTEVEGALQEAGAHLTNAAPVNVLSNKTYLRPALEKIQNDRKVAQMPAITIQGSTVINLLGRDGNCEDVSKWQVSGNHSIALDNTTKVQGANSIKVTATGAGGGGNYINFAGAIPAKDSQKYAVVVAMKATAGTPAIHCEFWGGQGIKLDNFLSTLWDVYVYKTITSGVGNPKSLHFWANGAAASFSIDAVAVIELTDAEYADANWQPPNYCESVQFLRNPIIKSNGKNISPDITLMQQTNYFTFDTSKYADCTAIKWYSSTAVTNADFITFQKIPIKPGVTYTLSGYIEGNINGNNAYIDVQTYDETGVLIDDVTQTLYTGNIAYTRTSQAFTPSAKAKFAEIRFVVQIYVSGTVWISKIQLEEGVTATVFEPNRDEQIVFPVALAEGEKIEYANGQAVITENWRKDVVLDGSLGWAFENDFVGYKRIRIPTGLGLKGTDIVGHISKYDGKVLKRVNYGVVNSGADEFLLDNRLTDGLITIADTDSGWGETYTPSLDEIKAYFWGWKMYDGTIGANSTYNGTGVKWWAHRNGNGQFINGTNVFPNYQAPINNDWKPYSIVYKLVQPRTYKIQPQGGISLVEGVNQVEVTSGTVLSEVANFVFNSGTNAYLLNNKVQPSSRLNYATKNILNVYKNGVKDSNAVINTQDLNAYGVSNVHILSANYDRFATYTVDYEILPEAHNTQKQIFTLIDNGSLLDVVNMAIRTVTKAQKDIASVLQELLYRNPVHKDVSAFRAYQTVSQSFSAGVDAKLVFHAKNFDNLGEFNPTTGTFTAKQAGLYLITAALTINPQVNGNRSSMRLFVNGVDHSRMFNDTVSSANDNTAIGSMPVWLKAGDYVEIMYYTANNVSSAPGATLSYITGLRIA